MLQSYLSKTSKTSNQKNNFKLTNLVRKKYNSCFFGYTYCIYSAVLLRASFLTAASRLETMLVDYVIH